MKLKASTGRKLRYNATSVTLTALVLAAIMIVNIIFTLIVQRFTLYVDLTPDLHFTISDECYELIGGRDDDKVDSPVEMIDKFRAENKAYNAENGLTPDSKDWRDEHVMINIVFCLEHDVLEADETMKYVLVNAEELESKYSDYIKVYTENSVRNPSRFAKYLGSNTDKIAPDSVIIECGTEFRVRTLRSFFVFQEDEPFAYNGEKAFASSILAVTRAEAPLACYTVNHGESFPTASEHDADGNHLVPFLSSVEDAGYLAQPIDLSVSQIPEECRILIIFDPKQDFLSGNDGTGAQGELSKIEDFLADRNSLMVFMNPDSYTGKLDNLEDFLAEWGVKFSRQGDDPYMIRDTQSSIMGDSSAVVGAYPNNQLANGWLESMLSGASAPKVVFPNATSITYAENAGYKKISDADDEDPSIVYTAGFSQEKNRYVYDLFVTSDNAKAYAANNEIAAATKSDPLKLATVSVQTYTEQEYLTAIDDSAFVMVCGSTDFASEKYLTSNAYGNSDLLLSVMQMAGREPVPVGLEYKEFANYEIETVTTKEATQYTVVLTLVPIVVSLCVGVFVIVRRKNR